MLFEKNFGIFLNFYSFHIKEIKCLEETTSYSKPNYNEVKPHFFLGKKKKNFLSFFKRNLW